MTMMFRIAPTLGIKPKIEVMMLRAMVKMAKPLRIAAVGVTTVADTAANGTNKWKVKRGKWKVIPPRQAAL